MGERQQVRVARRAACRRAAHRLRAPAAARRRRRGDAGRHDEPPGHRRRAAERLDLRGRLHREPVHPHAVRGLLPLPRRRAGRAHPDPVRHARGGERARRRLHGRVHGLPLPLLLHRRVRHRVRLRRPRRHPLPRWLGDPGHQRRARRPARPVRALRQADGGRVPHVLGPVHLPAPAGGPAPGARVEVPHPARAPQHRRHRHLQGGRSRWPSSSSPVSSAVSA